MAPTKTIPIIDGHNDTLQMLYMPGVPKRPFLERTTVGHIDIPRAIESGYRAGFFAIFIPSPKMVEYVQSLSNTDSGNDPCPFPFEELCKPISLENASELANLAIKKFHNLEIKSKKTFHIARTVDQLASACDHDDTLAAVVHFEGAEPITADLKNLHDFYQKGLRSIGLVWSRPNAFGHGVPLQFPGSPDCGPGLTEVGKELVQACSDKGIMVDLSHLNEKGFWDIEQMGLAPLITTHSCAHALCPSPRNLTDKQLDAIKATGGIVGLNFGVMFLRKDGAMITDTPMQTMVDHIRYISDRIGIDHIGFGSDFDGAKISKEIHDVTGFPQLIQLLRTNGFDEVSLTKMAYKNWLRVVSLVWK